MHKKFLSMAFILFTSNLYAQTDLKKLEGKIANLEKRIVLLEKKLNTKPNQKTKACKCGPSCKCSPCLCK